MARKFQFLFIRLAFGFLLFPFGHLHAEEQSRFSVISTSGPGEDSLIAEPIYMPEILLALRSLEVPQNAGSADVTVTRGVVSKSILHRFLKLSSIAELHGGSPEGIRTLVVSGGYTDIRSLAKNNASRGLLKCQENICELEAPLFVEAGAVLLIDDVQLNMHRAGGAFIASLGHLQVERSHLLTAAEPDCVFEAPYTGFRPFVAAMTGSRTVSISSQYTDLGYHAPKAYGFSVHANKGEVPPSAVLVGNVFVGLYYGFYSHHAHHVAIAGNIYRDNIIYGIDPHDYSEDLYILGNRAYGTKKKHGIVISRGVTRTTISGNHSYENNGTGIMLDRHSNGNVISHNVVSNNGIDGISVLESSDSRFVGNSAFGNSQAGIRVRNGRDLIIAKNNLISNGAFGAILYTAEPNGVLRREEDVFEKRSNATLIANYVSGNEKTDLQIKGCVDRLDLNLSTGRQPGFIDSRVGLPKNPKWRNILLGAGRTTGNFASVRYLCPEQSEAVSASSGKKEPTSIQGKRSTGDNCSPAEPVADLY